VLLLLMRLRHGRFWVKSRRVRERNRRVSVQGTSVDARRVTRRRRVSSVVDRWSLLLGWRGDPMLGSGGCSIDCWSTRWVNQGLAGRMDEDFRRLGDEGSWWCGRRRRTSGATTCSVGLSWGKKREKRYIEGQSLAQKKDGRKILSSRS